MRKIIEILEEAVKYFKSNIGYQRLLKGIKNKYISFGDIKGNVIITNPSKEEREALSGLMKKDYSKNKTININLIKLQRELENTRFSNINLKEFINKYFEEEILTKKENKEKYQEEIDVFFKEILIENEGTYVYPYLKQILESKSQIYYNLKKYYNKEKDLLRNSLQQACMGINNLPLANTRIPVFASNIINNPHGYDKKTLTGTIFVMLLSYINGISRPRNSEELYELYYKNHLLVDDVSNMVLCRNLVGYIEDKKEKIYKSVNCKENINENDDKISKKYKEHEGLSGFKKYNEPIYLTIYNLANIDCIEKNNKYKKVLITENPAVFMGIVEKCKIHDFPLICTYGQVKLAGIILLDLLVKQKFKLYYSGDIDPEGLQIADKLKIRYGENLNFIGLDKKTYLENMSNVYLSESRISKLNQIKSKELQEVAKALSKNRLATYEEENIDNLIDFIERVLEK